ncbi:hypothetical protein [Latilactobacillus graminis]|nr:hypothetical protein [Latilactobacillus graminis]QFP78791.1 hypothetical protein LG542_00345 [Latilactobacillus graminis]
MARKYLSKSTRTKHTYEFYKERRDNPQWRADFLEVRSKRRIEIAIQAFVILVIVAGGGFYFSKKGNAQRIAKPAEVETSTTTSSSVASTAQSDDETNSSVNSNQDESTGKDDDSQLTSSSAAQASTSNTESSTSQSADSSSEDGKYSGDELVVKKYINDGFIIMPIMYNGEDVTKAIAENKAPQNLMYDGYTDGYIKDDQSVRLSHMGGASDGYYGISNGTLSIKQGASRHSFRYTVNNGVVEFENENISEPDGAKVDFQIKPAPGASATVDSQHMQN